MVKTFPHLPVSKTPGFTVESRTLAGVGSSGMGVDRFEYLCKTSNKKVEKPFISLTSDSFNGFICVINRLAAN